MKRRFEIWAHCNHTTGRNKDDDVEILEMPAGATDEECEKACVDILDLGARAALDYIADRKGLSETEYQALLEVLPQAVFQGIVPWSSAHIAASYALLANKVSSYETAQEYQTKAGEWVVKGWNR